MRKRYILWGLFAMLLAACSGTGAAEPTATLTGQESAGKTAFSIHCAACHSVDPGAIIVGPSLNGVANRAGDRVAGMDAKTYLTFSILKPDEYIVDGFTDTMPKDLGTRLSGETFDAIIAYLLTLQ